MATRVAVRTVGSRLALDDDLLAAQPDPLLDAARFLAAGDAHLLHQPQALLDHEHFLHPRVDGGVALLADLGRRLEPAADRHALHLDGFGLDRDVHDLLVLVDPLAQAHRLGGDPLLVDHGRLLDDRNDLLVGRYSCLLWMCHEVPL